MRKSGFYNADPGSRTGNFGLGKTKSMVKQKLSNQKWESEKKKIYGLKICCQT